MRALLRRTRTGDTGLQNPTSKGWHGADSDVLSYACLSMDQITHWDCWCWAGNRTVSRPEPNTTPERAMGLLLEKARLVFGEQDWAAWTWDAKEYGTRQQRTIRFTFRGGSSCASVGPGKVPGGSSSAPPR